MLGKTGAILLLLCGVIAIIFSFVAAEPTGASITYNSTDPGPTVSPSGINTSRGTISTILLEATQQDQYWKGYVGNVSAALSLDDSNGYTIYDWNLVGVTVTGKVYAARNNNADFTSVVCANASTITTEQTFNNMSGTQVDNINATFNETLHQGFLVGTTTISNSSCPALYTYTNSTGQTASESADWQEVLLQDSSANVIYTTFITSGDPGYNNNNYDFQMIVAESDRKATPTTYYFWTEIST